MVRAVENGRKQKRYAFAGHVANGGPGGRPESAPVPRQTRSGGCDRPLWSSHFDGISGRSGPTVASRKIRGH